MITLYKHTITFESVKQYYQMGYQIAFCYYDLNAGLIANDNCPTCGGTGGTLEYDWEGDGVWGQGVTRLDPCADCLGLNRCPGCMQQYPQYPPSPAVNADDWQCPNCGWVYEEDRFYARDDDYYNATDPSYLM